MQSSRIQAGDNATYDQLNKAINDGRGAAMLQAHQQGTPDLTVYVEPGILYIGDTPVNFAGGNSPSFTAPAANPRIDLLMINASGVLSRLAGSEGASPSAPADPNDGRVLLFQIYNRVGQTEILDEDDASEGYISTDLRPFLRTSGINAGSLSDLTVTANGDNDATVNCGFRPKLIILYYYIQGRVTSGDNFHIKKGIAHFLGTTLAINTIMGERTSGADNDFPIVDTDTNTGSRMPVSASDISSPEPYAGNAGGADNARIILSINSVSATGFVVRRLVTGYNTGGNVRAKVSWVAFA